MQTYLIRLSLTLTVCPSLVLRPSQSCTLSPEPLPVESRIKQDKSDFEEQERQRVAQEARAERRQKKQVSRSEKKDLWYQTVLTQLAICLSLHGEQHLLSQVSDS